MAAALIAQAKGAAAWGAAGDDYCISMALLPYRVDIG